MKTFLILMIPFLLSAAPAFNRATNFTQPDGSHFKGELKGDEYLHWIEAESGDIVIYNTQTKRYEDALIGEDALRPSGKGFSATARSIGRASATTEEQLQRLWLKKRREAMEMRRKATSPTR